MRVVNSVWWQSKREAIELSLIAVLKDEIQVLRKRHNTDCERIDRLMEALARKANIDLVMPLPPPVPVERISVPNPWKDPNPVTDKFPESVGVTADTPTFSKETK